MEVELARVLESGNDCIGLKAREGAAVTRYLTQVAEAKEDRSGAGDRRVRRGNGGEELLQRGDLDRLREVRVEPGLARAAAVVAPGRIR